jgi:hypothetical protein
VNSTVANVTITELSHQKNCVLCSWWEQRRFKLNTEFLRLVLIREISPSFCGKKKENLKK